MLCPNTLRLASHRFSWFLFPSGRSLIYGSYFCLCPPPTLCSLLFVPPHCPSHCSSSPSLWLLFWLVAGLVPSLSRQLDPCSCALVLDMLGQCLSQLKQMQAIWVLRHYQIVGSLKHTCSMFHSKSMQ